MNTKIAMAIGAHPDDIEFMMAGTLLLLKRAGYEIHCMNLANGCYGSATHSAAALRKIRCREGQAAAKVLGAEFHHSLVDDLSVYYEESTLLRLAAVIREVNPSILLVPSPQDYMEDHTNTCRLAVSAAFIRSNKGIKTRPLRKPVDGDVTIYHAMPQGLRDPLRRRIIPGAYVNTTSVQEIKLKALSQHESQQEWLNSSQKMNQYLLVMDGFAREMGRMSCQFEFAEGWRRHMHYGYCRPDAEPLRDALGKNYLINQRYEESLEAGY